ncbi:MAG TPA: helix-turn-helix transcriptional regulator [Solirubrobacterales bacterium]|nr:helix-turn-helix transcriptional regulator [Solirubrobacterales bacterium]
MPSAAADIEHGRESYARRAWGEAHESLVGADQAAPLGAADLELLGRSAYMLGRDDEYVNALERAHQAYLDAGDAAPAARCAWWIGHNLIFRGERGPATGWFARGERLLESGRRDCAERGYLLLPTVIQHVIAGENEAAHAVAAEAAEIGERFGDRDLLALAVMEQGHALIRLGSVEEGLRLVDEGMVAVTAGELSPIVAGIVYCNTIAFCRDAFELRRAREWTAALTRWCEQQPEMVAHNGICLVHRAEIMTLEGAWRDALEEAGRVGKRFSRGALNQRAIGRAAYRRGEVHRLLGEFAAAEDAYSEASRGGREPQPGLALLRLAQGNGKAAAAGIRRAVSETAQALRRAELLPAYVEIMLAVGDGEAAHLACRELEAIAADQGSDALRAMSAQAVAAVALAEGDAQAALVAARRAWQEWEELAAPYEAAKARVLVGLACRTIGDEDAAALELDGARAAFSELGAAPDLARLDSPTPGPAPPEDHGLTSRELEVLRLVAVGKSNPEIAAELVISDHTVRRHLQNIFAKLGLSSRAAATAFAVRHDLV